MYNRRAAAAAAPGYPAVVALQGVRVLSLPGLGRRDNQGWDQSCSVIGWVCVCVHLQAMM